MWLFLFGIFGAYAIKTFISSWRFLMASLLLAIDPTSQAMKNES
jgi:hypothetical protein